MADGGLVGPLVTSASGASAALLGLEGELVRLGSTEAAAPGQPLAFALPNGQTLRLKTYRCRRRAPALVLHAPAPVALDFEIEGKLIDATRALRGLLAGWLAVER